MGAAESDSYGSGSRLLPLLCEQELPDPSFQDFMNCYCGILMDFAFRILPEV